MADNKTAPKPRNDNVLNTGTNSGSLGTKPPVAKVVKEKKEEKSLLKSMFLPAKDHILEMIEEEITKISTIEYFAAEELPDNDTIADELRARRKYLQFLKKLKQTVEKASRRTTND